MVVRALNRHECQSLDDVILVSNITCSTAFISFLVERHLILCSVFLFNAPSSEVLSTIPSRIARCGDFKFGVDAGGRPAVRKQTPREVWSSL